MSGNDALRQRRRNPGRFLAVAALLLCLSCVLHFWRIGAAPPGFYLDESSTLYNAWCIARTGADESGNRWPLFVQCFGDYYHDAAIIYCLAPLVDRLGLRESVGRSLSALFHIAASVAFGFLARQFVRNNRLALLAAFVFSIQPWTFPVSRTISGGYCVLLLGISAGSAWLMAALRKNSVGLAVAAALAWALAMHSYQIGRPMSVLMLGCFAVALNRRLRRRWKIAAAFLSSLAVALLPMAIAVLRQPALLTTRFQRISIFRDDPSAGQAVARFGARYIEYFGPAFLFFRGDENLRHHTGFGGEMSLFTLPLVLAGLFQLVRFWRCRPDYRLLALWLLTYPAAAALTMDRMHSMRSVAGAVLWLLVAAVGARSLWLKDKTRRRLLLALACFGSVEAGLYFRDYFGAYQPRCRNAFQAALTEALKQSFEALGAEETLYICGSAFAPLDVVVDRQFQPFYYAHILFFGRVEPRMYHRAGIPKEKVRLYEGAIAKPGLLLRCNVRLRQPILPGAPVCYEINAEPLPVNAKLLRTVPITESVRYEIYRVGPTGAAGG